MDLGFHTIDPLMTKSRFDGESDMADFILNGNALMHIPTGTQAILDEDWRSSLEELLQESSLAFEQESGDYMVREGLLVWNEEEYCFMTTVEFEMLALSRVVDRRN